MRRWLRNLLSWKNLFTVTSIVATTLAFQYLEFRRFFANMEGAVLDVFLRKVSQESQILIVDISETAYRQCFSSTSPLNPDRLAALINAIRSSNPAIIGVDILTDSIPADQSQAYRELATRATRTPQTVWAARFEQSFVSSPNFFEWLAGIHDRVTGRPSRILGYEPGTLPSKMWGLSIFLRDEDGHLRKVPRRLSISSTPESPVTAEEKNSLPRAIAEMYCHRHPCKLRDSHDQEVYFSFGPIQRFNVEHLFRCPAFQTGDLWDEFVSKARESIVLVGGSFAASKDVYATPIGLSTGLEINAHAIDSEITGAVVTEVPRYIVAALDLLFGCTIVRIFTHSPNIRRNINLALLLTLLAALMSILLAEFGFVWLTWIGVAVGVCPHIVWELYH